MSEESTSDNFPAQWALDLLQPDPRFATPPLRTYFAEIAAGGAVMLGGFLFARFNSTPLAKATPTVLYRTTLAVAVTYAIHLMADYRNNTRDESYRQYIRLHPERFPEPKRYKYGELFEPWTPVR